MACNLVTDEKKENEKNKLADTSFINKVNRLPENKKEIINIEHLPDTTGRWLEYLKEKGRVKDEMSLTIIDTVSLKAFWHKFQKDILSDNRKSVIDYLEFPIRAIYPVLFQYAHDCDTTAYITNEVKYSDFDIDGNNIIEYYDFIFSDELKDVILQTSVDDILKKGIRYKLSTGVSITYQFFPKNYNVKTNCPNDHLLKFHMSREEKGWKISIGGL